MKKATRKEQIKRARKLSGFTGQLDTKSDFEAAVKFCTRALAVSHPDIGGDRNKAAEIGEAKAIFQRWLKRFTGKCAECGAVINPGATHCQLHKAKPKAMALPPTFEKPKSESQNGNVRLVGAPSGGLKAEMGYYANPIQKVVKKWHKIMREEWMEDCFMAIAQSVRFREQEMTIRCLPIRWDFVSEMLASVVKLYSNKTKPEYWLLKEVNLFCKQDGKAATMEEIQKMISDRGGRDSNGKPFTVGQLNTCYSRLKLPPTDEMAAGMRADGL